MFCFRIKSTLVECVFAHKTTFFTSIFHRIFAYYTNDELISLSPSMQTLPLLLYWYCLNLVLILMLISTRNEAIQRHIHMKYVSMKNIARWFQYQKDIVHGARYYNLFIIKMNFVYEYSMFAMLTFFLIFFISFEYCPCDSITLKSEVNAVQRTSLVWKMYQCTK